MNYKKIKRDNYNLHLINTDRFKTITVSLKFTKKYNREESVYFKLLERVLPINGTENYKSVNDITKKLESLYNANIGYKFYVTSENMTFETNLRIINPKYTKEDTYKESFDLFKEILTKPTLKNNQFKYFDLQKDNLVNSILNVKDDLRSYSSLKFQEIFYKGTVYAENNYKNIKLFEDMESKKLYENYKKLFSEFKIDVFVIGEFDEEVLTKYIEELMKGFKSKDNYTKDLYTKVKCKESLVKDKFKESQSCLLIGLNINGLTDEERDYKLILYNTILGSMNNSVLFVNVREKNSLCYSIGSTISKFTETMIIRSGISSDSFDDAVRLIKESLEEMKDEKKVDKLLKNAKKTLNIAYNDFYESSNKIIDYYFIREFTILPSIEERREKVMNLTSKDVTDIAKKVSIGLIYLMEGTL
ncbi:MAG: insulinase family protein [Tenericutes bacterium]|nr:insulinase family protein [Mycoplasmatota bacterium]